MIQFDSSIYNRKAIEQAVTDYREIADICIFYREGFICCDIRNTQAESQLIFNEFSNYVLNLTVALEGKEGT